MWARVTVLPKPLFDDDLSLLRCCEPFCVKHFLTSCSVEPFAVSVVPARAWIDANRLETDASKPVLHRFGREPEAVV